MNQPNRVEAWIPDDDEKPLVILPVQHIRPDVMLISQSED